MRENNLFQVIFANDFCKNFSQEIYIDLRTDFKELVIFSRSLEVISGYNGKEKIPCDIFSVTGSLNFLFLYKNLYPFIL